VERVVDSGIHGLIAASVIWSLRRNRFGWTPSGLILALPALALASAAWSLAPIVTLGFAFQLVAIYLLATLTAAIYREDPQRASTVLRRALRVLVQGVAVLCLVGLAFPYQGDPTTGDVARFTWPGSHPLVATADIGLAILVILFARKEIGFSRATSAGVLALFGYCLYLGQARTAFIGLAVALLFGLWSAAEGRGWVRRLAGIAALLAAALAIESMFGGPITDYLYRGQSQQQVYSLNGRLGLWTFAIHQLHSAGQWLFGYGLGGSRVLLASSVLWAGDAHGAWIELLLSLGLVGVAVGAGVVATLAWRLFQSARAGSLASRAIPVLFVYVLAMSPAATGFAAPGPEPGLGFGLLAFCYGATAGPRRRLSSAVAQDPGRAGPRVVAVPRDTFSPLPPPRPAGGLSVRT
jgi:O-antigen ligase